MKIITCVLLAIVALAATSSPSLVSARVSRKFDQYSSSEQQLANDFDSFDYDLDSYQLENFDLDSFGLDNSYYGYDSNDYFWDELDADSVDQSQSDMTSDENEVDGYNNPKKKKTPAKPTKPTKPSPKTPAAPAGKPPLHTTPGYSALLYDDSVKPSAFECIRKQGFDSVRIASANNVCIGGFDSLYARYLQQASTAGFKGVDLLWWPSSKCGTDSASVAAMVSDMMKSTGGNFRKLWINVGAENLRVSPQVAKPYLMTVLDELVKVLGTNRVGISTSQGKLKSYLGESINPSDPVFRNLFSVALTVEWGDETENMDFYNNPSVKIPGFEQPEFKTVDIINGIMYSRCGVDTFDTLWTNSL